MKNINRLTILPSDYGNIISYLFCLLKVYLFFGFALGLSSSIVRIIKLNTFDKIIEDVVFMGLAPAVPFLIIIMLLDIVQKLKNYLKYKVIVFNVNQEKVLTVKGPYKDVYALMYNVLNDCPIVSINNYDIKALIIIGETKRSWKSVGEYIHVKMEDISGEVITIKIRSEPKWSFVMVDYCKNFENVEMIIGGLKKAMMRGMPGRADAIN